MNSSKKLLVIKIDNVVDIITNSSSELFVLEGNTLEIVEEMISDVYPGYLSEYESPVCLRDAPLSKIDTYLGYVEDKSFPYNTNRYSKSKEELHKEELAYYANFAKRFDMDPNEFYSNWRERNKEFFWTRISEEGLRKAAETLDPDGKMFLLFSIDDNPEYEMQEQLQCIGIRYHLG